MLYEELTEDQKTKVNERFRYRMLEEAKFQNKKESFIPFYSPDGVAFIIKNHLEWAIDEVVNNGVEGE